MGAQTMITILKNNERMLGKRTKFRKTLGGYGKNKKPEYDFPTATPKQLRDIRKKLKKENQILWVKIIGLTIVISIALVWLFFAS
ncbi:hypothetical protein [uncultured Winogradskyella sp.]|uniref:hypothetical protein n=1 Tax=uncultured Winogradskyella sp. TaxID=395353 RepID=UPI0026126167|nr:hypothetical protein [uncultured Winogradskyella sp.]